MNRRHKALVLAAVLCCVALPALAGGLLGFEAPGSQRSLAAVLYFRYQDSPWLGQELRQLEVSHTQSLERALVEALLAGPAPGRDSYRPLFPADTQVINVLAEGARLYVTFSARLLDPLPGEGSGPQALEEARLRRRLAMAALANTLTETGEYTSVQVLVLDQPQASGSMRLSQRYFLEDSDSLPDPQKRDEDSILTPGRAAGYILGLWQKQEWGRFTRLLAASPEDSEALNRAISPQQMPLITLQDISPGSLGFEGRSAIVLLKASLQGGDGQVRQVEDFPLRMLRQDQDWLLSLPSLRRLLGEEGP